MPSDHSHSWRIAFTCSSTLSRRLLPNWTALNDVLFTASSDVMSLIVALYAIKLTKNNVASAEYSYGWHRAEILAALINGVFLLALCFSIFIEAIERFFSVPGGFLFSAWGILSRRRGLLIRLCLPPPVICTRQK